MGKQRETEIGKKVAALVATHDRPVFFVVVEVAEDRPLVAAGVASNGLPLSVVQMARAYAELLRNAGYLATSAVEEMVKAHPEEVRAFAELFQKYLQNGRPVEQGITTADFRLRREGGLE